MSPFMDGMLGRDFEKGLARLKKVVEEDKNNVVASDIKIEEVTVPAMHALTTRDTASNATISIKIGMCYGEIGKTMKKQGLKEAGYPFTVYHDYHENYFS